MVVIPAGWGRLRACVVVVAVALLLAGCLSRERRYAEANEQGLAAAGFQVRLADTPEKLAHVQTLIQRKILVYKWQGRLYYVWADATVCKCLYVGTEQQYQRYARLGTEASLAAERRTAVEENEAAALFGQTWGPWD